MICALLKETLLSHLMYSTILPTSNSLHSFHYAFLKETNFSPELLLLMHE